MTTVGYWPDASSPLFAVFGAHDELTKGEWPMSYTVTLRIGVLGCYSSLEAALESAESLYASNEAEYCVDDENGTVTYRLHGMASPQD